MTETRRDGIRRLHPITLALLGLVMVSAAWASGYQTPPDPLPAIIDAPPTPQVLMSPDRQWMLLLESPNLLSLADLSEPELRLAGRRISPRTNGPTRDRPVTGLPDGAGVGGVRWSPDGRRIAFALTSGSAIELWVAEVVDGKARRLGAAALNLAAGTTPRWFSDSRTIV